MKPFWKWIGFQPLLFMGTAALAVTLSAWLYTAGLTEVEVKLYEEEKQRVFSRAEDVQGLLQEQEIEKEAGHRVHPSRYHPLEEGMVIELREPLPWEENAYEKGFWYTLYTASLAETLEAKAFGRQTGEASWYGSYFQGRPTTSGEIFDKHTLTAAHRELPLGTWVEVTFMRTGESVLVRINDRGPFVGDRIIDLSLRAADEIGLAPHGVGRVRVEIVGTESDYPMMMEYIAAKAEKHTDD